MIKKNANKIVIVFLILCMLIMPINSYAEEILLDSTNAVNTELSTNSTDSSYTPNVTITYKPEEQKELSIPSLGSKAVYIAEPTTGKVIYEKNAHEVRYPASTTKILTALLVLENCKLDDVVTISQNAVSLVPDGYSNANLRPGEEHTVKDLLYALMLPSANEAANALAEHISGSVEAFAELSNKRAKELGCENLHFVNPNGIHDDNHSCTAYDLYLIAKECQKYDIFNEVVTTKTYTLPSTPQFPGTRTLKNTNDMLSPGTYYYENCTGIKTGTTTPAGQCLVASSSKDGINLISVVLGGGTNAKGLADRFYDTKELFEFTYNNYSVKEIANYGDKVATLNVGKATKETSELDVIVDTDISTIVPNDLEKNNIKSEINFKDDIVAPIKQNEVLGTVSFSADGLIYTTNIIASHPVEKLPYWLYNIIAAISIIVILLLLLIVLIKTQKKNRLKVFVIEIIILIGLIFGTVLIMQEGARNSITKYNLENNINTEEVQNTDSDKDFNIVNTAVDDL